MLQCIESNRIKSNRKKYQLIESIRFHIDDITTVEWPDVFVLKVGIIYYLFINNLFIYLFIIIVGPSLYWHLEVCR